MNKLIKENELDQLLNFIGYGRIDADIWFVGVEEKATSENEIQSRVNFDQVLDSFEAQEMLGVGREEFVRNNFNEAGAGIAKILLMLGEVIPTEKSIQEYLDHQLGLGTGPALIASLFPLPMKQDQTWQYQDSFPQFVSYDDYINSVKQLRFDLFKELIHFHSPKMVICYGKAGWPLFQELFGEYNLADSGEFQLGWDANTVVILADDLNSENLADKYDELIKMIKENSLAIDTSTNAGETVLSKSELERQQKQAAKQASAAKRKATARHNPADPYCVCAYCLGYESKK